MCGKKTIICLAAVVLSAGVIGSECKADKDGKLHQARENVKGLIEAGKFAEGEAATEEISKDFPNDGGLAEAQYLIAEKFEQRDGFGEAKRVCRRIIRQEPASRWADRARVLTSRVEIEKLIMRKDFKAAMEAIVHITRERAGNGRPTERADIAEAIYWTAERFERFDRFEEAGHTYRRVAERFPGTAFGEKAKFGQAKAEAMALIVAEDYDGARVRVAEFVKNYEGDGNFPWAFYWITERYDRAGRFEEAKAGLELITGKFPDSTSASGARLRLAKIAIISQISANDYDRADAGLEKMIRDYGGHRELGFAVIRVGEEYERRRETAETLERAKRVFKTAADKIAVTSATPEACVWAGDACMELEQDGEAVEFYKRACDGYPQYASAMNIAYRHRALFMIGQGYQKMGGRGDIGNEEATAKAAEAYERMEREFPDGPLAKDGWRELGFLYAGREKSEDTVRCFEQYRKYVPDERCSKDVFYELAKAYDGIGDKESAEKNYKQFIGSATPNDERRKEVKNRLAEIKDTD